MEHNKEIIIDSLDCDDVIEILFDGSVEQFVERLWSDLTDEEMDQLLTVAKGY